MERKSTFMYCAYSQHNTAQPMPPNQHHPHTWQPYQYPKSRPADEFAWHEPDLSHTALAAQNVLPLHGRPATYSLSFPYFLAQTPCLCSDRVGCATPLPQTRADKLHNPAMLTHADFLAFPQILRILLTPGGSLAFIFNEGKGFKRMLYTNCRTMQLAAWCVFVETSLAGKTNIGPKCPCKKENTACLQNQAMLPA